MKPRDPNRLFSLTSALTSYALLIQTAAEAQDWPSMRRCLSAVISTSTQLRDQLPKEPI